ncbi:response regulator transcription factor [Neolewinella antarctica]|uniref:DNA-binding response OmpR family regulator n=1 Tax=Neolewinella antarctica TaxID=442734 RepID=A0ABX0XG09_9BACT|nr:response regulator transcription factor [Neolewinella antarctica]NJC28152.1 DNA-binding response OmpR family regulator [Neolewinella antarctica]
MSETATITDTAVAPKILLVEDDQNFGNVLRDFLSNVHDFDVTLATDGLAGFEAYRKGEWDLCIFDVMMPRLSGFELAKKVRENDTKTPIIFLTAKAMKEDILNGFQIGADDYITKPFNSDELLARMNVILRRTATPADPKDEQTEFEFGQFHFVFPVRILTHTAADGTEHKEKLSPKEAQLMRLFAINKNEVLSRSEALTKIWGEDNYFTARSMDVFVTKLRKYVKLDENIEIVNIHGNGFQLLIKG